MSLRALSFGRIETPFDSVGGDVFTWMHTKHSVFKNKTWNLKNCKWLVICEPFKFPGTIYRKTVTRSDSAKDMDIDFMSCLLTQVINWISQNLQLSSHYRLTTIFLILNIICCMGLLYVGHLLLVWKCLRSPEKTSFTLWFMFNQVTRLTGTCCLG